MITYRRKNAGTESVTILEHSLARVNGLELDRDVFICLAWCEEGLDTAFEVQVRAETTIDLTERFNAGEVVREVYATVPGRLFLCEEFVGMSYENAKARAKEYMELLKREFGQRHSGSVAKLYWAIEGKEIEIRE